MIPFYRPYFDHAEIVAALRPGTGRDEFESALAARVGARYGIAFAYGRSGVMAALKALGLSQAEVVLPAYTCEVMARAVVASGNIPAFADISLGDYNMDLGALKRALSPRTRAVVATHLYGYPADVDAIRALVGDERVTIIEDAAQGMPGFSPGANGLRGDLGLFSFGPGKPLSTAQGGVIVTNSADLYARIKAYRDQAMNQTSVKVWAKRWAWFLASYLVFHQTTYGLLHWYRRRRRAAPDGNLRPATAALPRAMPGDVAVAFADFQARIGLVQLGKLDGMLASRRTLVALYDRELRDLPGIHPAAIVPGATYAYYTLRVPRRDESHFRSRMLDQGISIDQTFDYALPCLEPYRAYGRGDYPCAEQAARQVVNLPLYPGLSAASTRYIAESTRRALATSNADETKES